MSSSVSVPLSLQVVEVLALAPQIRGFRLRATDGEALPGFEPGAHVRVQVDLPEGRSDWRQYSLIDLSTDPRATAAPADYLIAVRREDEGRGGSLFMHGLQVGQVLAVQPPVNEFVLGPCAGEVLLLAGGIGVTPLITMAARRLAQALPVRMVYAGRDRASMAYVQELQQLLGDRLSLHMDADAGAPLAIDQVLAACAADMPVYVCGPKPMLDAVLAQAQVLGWPRERIHFEVFNAPQQQAGDGAFEVVLAQSGRTLSVAADRSLLDVLIDEGCDPMYDCKRGECGVCAVDVIEGEVDHRDYVLSEHEKQTGRVMHPCVSRCKGARLVLDI